MGVGAFGLNGMSSVLMRCMRSIFGRPELAVDPIKSRPAGHPVTSPSMLCHFVLVYRDETPSSQ